MLITRPYISPEKQLEFDLRDCGIRTCMRKIIFFVDKLEFENHCCKIGKAIQINLSVECGRVTESMRSIGLITDNSTTIKNSVYKYDVFFPYGTDDLSTANMILKDAYSVDEMNDFDNRLRHYRPIGLYNKDVSMCDGKIGMLESEGFGFKRASIIDPKYYTEEHQLKRDGETYSIIWDNFSHSYLGQDLIDAHTVVEIHDLKTYDTMVPFLQKEIMEKSTKQYETNTVNFISDLFTITSEPIIYDYGFVYETGKGIGVNPLHPGKPIIYSGFRIKENLISNLQLMKDMVEAEAKMIEQDHGRIRLHYVPKMTGDKLEIKFDDYAKDNQPDFNTTKIDKGYTIEENIMSEINEKRNSYTAQGPEF